MKNTEALKTFITEDQILECLVLFESRKREACDLLKTYIWDKWNITTLEAMGILQNVSKEFETKKP